MQQGQIWLAIWPNDPSKKLRPVLIVSNNLRNSQPNILDTVVVKLTSYQRTDGSPKPVNQAEDFLITLKKKTIVRCGSLYSIPKSILNKQLGMLSLSEIKMVRERLANVFDLHETLSLL